MGDLPAQVIRPGRLEPLARLLQKLFGFLEMERFAKTHGLGQRRVDPVAQLGPLPYEPCSASTGRHRENQRSCHERGACGVALAPAPYPSRPTYGPGPDRTALPKPLQVICKRRGTFVTPRGFLLQAFEADGFQVARDLAIEARGPSRFLGQNLPLCFRRGFGAKRWTPGEQFVEAGPQ